MISWEYFKSVRKLKVDKWMSNLGIKSYEDLVNVLVSLGVSPPGKESVSDLFPKAKKVTAPRVKAAPAQELKQEEPAVEEQAEKPKPTRRRRSTKKAAQE